MTKKDEKYGSSKCTGPPSQVLNTCRSENESLSQKLSSQLLINHSLLCIPNLQTTWLPDRGGDFQRDFSMLRSQLFYKLSAALVAVTTFNNIFLCVCIEWKRFDFCLISTELDVGKKTELNHFRLYACNVGITSPLQMNSVQVASYLYGGNSELKIKTRALVEQARKGSWESYSTSDF